MFHQVITSVCPVCGAPGKAGCLCEYCGTAIPYPAGMQPSAPVVEQTDFKVVLMKSGPARLNAIKVINDKLHLGLKESMDLVDRTPSTLLEKVSKEEANALKEALENVGAVVEIQ